MQNKRGQCIKIIIIWHITLIFFLTAHKTDYTLNERSFFFIRHIHLCKLHKMKKLTLWKQVFSLIILEVNINTLSKLNWQQNIWSFKRDDVVSQHYIVLIIESCIICLQKIYAKNGRGDWHRFYNLQR